MADARAPPPSTTQAANAAPYPLSGERTRYPTRMAVDFTQLGPHALQRYLAFHGLPFPPGSSHEALAVLVARHFGDACARADEAKSILSFVSYVTQDGTASALKRRKVATKQSREGPDAMDPGPVGHEPSGAAAVDEDQTADAGPLLADERTMRRRRYSDEDADEALEEVFADENAAGNELFDDGDDSFDEQPGAERARAAAKARGAGGASAGAKGEPHKRKKAHRKARLYCVCRGASFGDMIACDNKTCLDRSNWYHMSCVGLDPDQPPPETWFCPLCRDKDVADIPENQYRKPVASVTYGDMISHALTVLPGGKGTFKEICDFVEKQYESQLNWKLESDQRKSPVWKSSVRKILFSNMRFRKHPEDKGFFCLAG